MTALLLLSRSRLSAKVQPFTSARTEYFWRTCSTDLYITPALAIIQLKMLNFRVPEAFVTILGTYLFTIFHCYIFTSQEMVTMEDLCRLSHMFINLFFLLVLSVQHHCSYSSHLRQPEMCLASFQFYLLLPKICHEYLACNHWVSTN